MSLQSSIERAQQDPNSPFAVELRSRIESGAMDRFAQQEGITLPGREAIITEPEVQPTLVERGADLVKRGAGVVETVKAALPGSPERVSEEQRRLGIIKEAQAAKQEKLRTGGFEETKTIGEEYEKAGAIFGSGIEGIKTGFKDIATGLDPTQEQAISERAEDIFSGVVDTIQGGVTINPIVSLFPLLPDFVEKPVGEVFEFLGGLGDKGASKLISFLGGDPESRVGVKTREAASLLAQLKGGKTIGEAGVAGVKKVAKTRPVQEFAAGLKAKPAEARAKFTEELILPKESKKTGIEEIKRGRVEELGVKGRERTLNQQQIEIAKDVSKIEGVKESNTNLQNVNEIISANTKLAETLIKDIRANDAIFPKKELNSVLKKNMEKGIAESELFIVSESLVPLAQFVFNKFNSLLEGKPNKASSVFEARQALDAWAKKNPGGEKQLTPEAMTAKAEALRIIRTTANKFVSDKVQNVNVTAELKNQSNLYRAIEEIAPKAEAEAATPFKRQLQQVHEQLGFTGEVGATISAIGLSSVGLLPLMLKLGIVIFVTKKTGEVVFSPEAKAFVGGVLENAKQAKTIGVPPIQDVVEAEESI